MLRRRRQMANSMVTSGPISLRPPALNHLFPPHPGFPSTAYAALPIHERITPGMAAMVVSLAATILTITNGTGAKYEFIQCEVQANSENRGSIKQNRLMFGTPH